MLGRLRMPVSDCIEEYQKLAESSFGRPRLINQMNTAGIISRSKYNTAKLEKAIQSLIVRRLGPKSVHLFKFDADLCRT